MKGLCIYKKNQQPHDGDSSSTALREPPKLISFASGNPAAVPFLPQEKARVISFRKVADDP